MMTETPDKRCGGAISTAEFEAEAEAQAEQWRDAIDLMAESLRIAREAARKRARRRLGVASAAIFGGGQ